MTTAIPLDPINDLISGTVLELDITETMHGGATTEYQHVGQHLAEASKRRGTDIVVHTQGSFLIGTVVRPLGRIEFDIDMVARYHIERNSVTQKELKRAVGEDLEAFVRARRGSAHGPIDCHEKARAWTLIYPGAFHLDVLPSIPDDTAASASAILVPDRDLLRWQHSDPLAYAAWFAQRGERQLVLKEARAYVAHVPVFTQRNVLQRSVQVIKRHRDMFFADDPDRRPPSILITTLAGLTYNSEAAVLDAVISLASNCEDHIDNRNGVWWVPNPVAEQENFVESWTTHPERRVFFYEWLESLRAELGMARTWTVQEAIRRLRPMLGETEVIKAAERVAGNAKGLRETGALTIGAAGATLATGGGTRVRDHQYYGQG